MRRFVVIVVVGVALMTPMRMALADSENKAFTESESFKQLSAEWWQWALSIPTSVNPQLETQDTKPEKCMVGDIVKSCVCGAGASC